jgi:hypothetical protein
VPIENHLTERVQLEHKFVQSWNQDNVGVRSDVTTLACPRIGKHLQVQLGDIVSGVFTPVLAKHTKHLSFVDTLGRGGPHAAQVRADQSTSSGLAGETAF